MSRLQGQPSTSLSSCPHVWYCSGSEMEYWTKLQCKKHQAPRDKALFSGKLARPGQHSVVVGSASRLGFCRSLVNWGEETHHWTMPQSLAPWGIEGMNAGQLPCGLEQKSYLQGQGSVGTLGHNSRVSSILLMKEPVLCVSWTEMPSEIPLISNRILRINFIAALRYWFPCMCQYSSDWLGEQVGSF